MSSLCTKTPHRVAHESLQIRRRRKPGEDMAAGIGDAGEGRGYLKTGIGSQDIEHAWLRDGDLRRGLCQNGRRCGRLGSIRNIR